MATVVKYNDTEIATVTNTTKTLKTSQKYATDNITITDSSEVEGTIDITENNTTVDVAAYATANVAVPSGVAGYTEEELQTLLTSVTLGGN